MTCGTPFVSPGQTSTNVSNTASQNLAQVSGSTVTSEDVDTDVGDSRPVPSVAVMLPGSTLVTAPGNGTNGLDVDVTRVQSTVTVDSELPTAAALADAASNPTAHQVGAAGELFNGTTWDRARSIAASGAGLGVHQVGTLGELITPGGLGGQDALRQIHPLVQAKMENDTAIARAKMENDLAIAKIQMEFQAAATARAAQGVLWVTGIVAVVVMALAAFLTWDGKLSPDAATFLLGAIVGASFTFLRDFRCRL